MKKITKIFIYIWLFLLAAVICFPVVFAVSGVFMQQWELEEYLAAGYPVYAAVTTGGQYTGYIVCRVEEPCVWAESIYVCPEKRRCGIASALFEKAEELARSYGEETVYNYVHPNNDKMIGFLASKGYNVLNLIEIRKPYNGEKLHTKMQVGGNSFDY